MKIAIILIHYNTAKYLASCLPSILNQTKQDFDLIFIDNASPDHEGLSHMRQHYDSDPRVTIIANTENKGYAAAANQGIKIANDRGIDYIAITNPDILFSQDYFEKVYARLRQDHKLAAITGKIYKYDFDKQQETDIIDSVGLQAHKNRRITDEGQGIIDQGQFSREKEVFGVSGACPFYSMEALEDIKDEQSGQYFDEDFFMYKEDVDLAWRLRLHGWKALYFPEALAYHGRGTGVFRRFTPREILRGRGKLNKFQKQFSFRNQLLMQLKNETWGGFFRNFFHIMCVQFIIPFYITFFEPYLWKSYLQFWAMTPKFLKKRGENMRTATASAGEMAKWFS